MANGYEKGDYLAQFLNQLPQMYQARKNSELQRERFEYMKEEGFKDDAYRSQALSSNQERNRLARDEFEQRKNQNREDEAYRASALANATKTQEYNEFNQAYDAFSASGNKGAMDYLLKSKYKGNQQMIDRINEHTDVTETMEHEVNSLLSLPPETRLLAARKLSTSPFLTPAARTTVKTTIDEGVEDLQFTLNKLKGTEAAAEYLQLITQLEDPITYAPREEGKALTPEQIVAFQNTVVNKLAEVRQSGFLEYRKSFGKFPTYDNLDIEGADDEEIDAYIADFSDFNTQFAERYPPLPREASQLSKAGVDVGVQPATSPVPVSPTAPTQTQALTTVEDSSQAPSAYTGKDVGQKNDVDFFFSLLQDGEISRKKFMEEMKKANINVQSIDLSMVRKQEGKSVKKELSEKDKDSIKSLANQIEQLKTRNFDKQTLEDKINRRKAKILTINPNYKFKD